MSDQVEDKTKKVRPLIFKIAALGLAVIILFLSLQPATGQIGLPYMDKLHHALGYGALMGLAAFGWPRWGLGRLVMIVALFGVAVELWQGFGGSGRTMSALDALANLIGALIAAFFLKFFRS